jgi:hypothetical protein
MKRLLSILLAGAMLVAMTGLSQAAIGWAGQIWPVNGTSVTEGLNVDVYLQIWKDGVTNGEGQGAGISATLFYGPTDGPFTSVAMTYNVDKGNNDEYKGTIPASAFEGLAEYWFYCEAYDSTDATTYTGAQDQNGNNPPFKLKVTPALSQDVLVYFFLCVPPIEGRALGALLGDVCITGDHTELTNWGDGVLMSQPCVEYSPRFYQVSVLFHAGSNPYVEYKYKDQGCTNWESGGNHSVFIDESSPVFYVPWIDHFNWYEGPDCPPCGVGVEPSTWGAIKQIYR